MGERSVKLLVMATMLEAKPFVSGLGLEQLCEKPFLVFKNAHQVLIISGIGKTHAAGAACYGFLGFSPKTVINIGAAGALDTKHPAGAIYQADKIIEHDRPDIFSGKPVFHSPDQMDGIDTAVLATGDRPVIAPEDRKRLSALAELVDMEAASVVQTCRTLNVPCHVFKIISDDPGHTAGTDIVYNIKIFRQKLFDFYNASILPKLD